LFSKKKDIDIVGYLAILPNKKANGGKMDNRTQKKYEARAKIIKAMAHPTRLFILDELNKSELCVCELTEMVGADMSTVSKHLSLLKNAGLVYTEKRKAKVFYKLRVPCLLNSFTCVEKVIKMNIQENIDINSG
jgi:ArsR family transcriptional regulator